MADEATSRTSAYEALGTLIKFAPEDALPVVSNTLVVILERSERLLSMQGQLVGDDDRRNYAELQVAFCAVLTVSVPSQRFETCSLTDIGFDRML